MIDDELPEDEISNSEYSPENIIIRDWNELQRNNGDYACIVYWTLEDTNYCTRFVSKQSKKEEITEDFLKKRLVLRAEYGKENDLEENVNYEEETKDKEYNNYEIINIDQDDQFLSIEIGVPNGTKVLDIPHHLMPFQDNNGKPNWYRILQDFVEKEKERQEKLKQTRANVDEQEYKDYIGKVVEENE